MLSIDFIRQNKEKVIAAAKNKNREVDIEAILKFDERRKDLSTTIQKLREERNKLATANVTQDIREKGKKIKEEIKKNENKHRKIEEDLQNLLLHVPNVPLDEVPVGKDSSGNVELRKWGTVPHFDFPSLSHLDLGKKMDVLDLERGSKVSGFRGYFLKNEGAILHFTLLNYVFLKLIKKGYTPLIAPSVIKGFTLFGSGQFPWGEQEVYKLNDEDAYLAGTAEVPVTSFFANETLNIADLPKKFVALSPCYRREAGSYGKDTKGIYRLHEFWKIEQVIIAENNLDEAKKLHAELQANCEEILQELEIPYRVMLMCTGDMGEPQLIKYDTEAWMPSRDGYGETMSNSIMGDFQTRRLNIKYKTKEGKTEYCFSLNNTALASPRILIALLENHQQKDGSVSIPKTLQSFVGFDKIEAK